MTPARNGRRIFLVRVGAAVTTAVVFSCGGEVPRSRRLARVGILQGDPRPGAFDPFFAGMKEIGYVERETVSYERRAGALDVMRGLAQELIDARVEVIVTGGTGQALRAKEATTSVPIVMLYSADPVELGVVSSLARPGGNVTGLASLTDELSGKQVELLREILPRIARVGVLWAPSVPAGPVFSQQMHSTIERLGLEFVSLELRRPEDLDATFQSARSVDGLVVQDSGPTVQQLDRILALVGQHRWPTVWSRRYVVEEKSGLLSYGDDFDALMRRGAYYVDRIVKGARPADLPIERSISFELAVNLKTAKELGLVIPQSVLGRATRVIQ